MRQVADGETAGVFLRHGKPVKTDELIGVYTNPVFERVFEAQGKVFEKLKDVFQPKIDKVVPRKLSRETIAEIIREKKAGTKTKFLAKKYEVSETTIRYYTRKGKIDLKKPEK